MASAMGRIAAGTRIEEFYRVAFSKPFIDTVTYSNLADTDDSTISNSGLLTRQLEPKKSFGMLKKLREAIFVHKV